MKLVVDNTSLVNDITKCKDFSAHQKIAFFEEEMVVPSIYVTMKLFIKDTYKNGGKFNFYIIDEDDVPLEYRMTEEQRNAIGDVYELYDRNAIRSQYVVNVIEHYLDYRIAKEMATKPVAREFGELERAGLRYFLKYGNKVFNETAEGPISF